MAKEIHGYIKTFLVIGAIIFAGGGYAMIVKGNAESITKIERVDERQNDEIHALQLADKDIANIAEKSLEVMGSIDIKLQSIQTTQTQQAVINAVNSEKLKTLTKD